ncbi:hydroxymethylglutaryl-CoA lyase [Novosphingobium capsulatum]|uniref:Hydroxymethylglutaryl-CoA lyase n=1 Tax=Novosphingobium capsulatum TaxID=13688 RepID=A0ABU1MPZ0_9SPHN|nr:hydroxymethylglutaryl-CoA lyase [Novosphingobium capsulatum]MDR6512218.1 hydroxymethylglutaryl-CoA lyase [Novosphingobium capsulatum]WQD94989.1 hydroxymethylglutaryl-CoA lyase [Novosphingobium capsulatum]
MYTESIEMVEVAPRDGLQNEKTMISTADKIALVERAIAAGARRIEVTSFVNPKAVPQMADAEAVCAGLPRRDDVTYIGLVMNARGAARAIETGRIDQLGAVSVATDTFAKANQGQTSDGSVAAASEIIAMARQAGKTGQVTIAAAFGCPFEGEVSEDRVVAMAEALAQANPVEIGLADTIGVANPAHVATLVARVRAAVPAIPVRVHFHNTRGTGLANVWAAIGAGAVTVDAAIGGLGGCPFAPGAAGNVSTEDVVYMLERAGVRTGLDLAALVAANHWLGSVMDRTLPGMVAKAPPFPRPAQA